MTKDLKLPKRVTDGTLNRIQALANKAADARDELEELLDACKKLPGWEQACEGRGIYPGAHYGDWMC